MEPTSSSYAVKAGRMQSVAILAQAVTSQDHLRLPSHCDGGFRLLQPKEGEAIHTYAPETARRYILEWPRRMSPM